MQKDFSPQAIWLQLTLDFLSTPGGCCCCHITKAFLSIAFIIANSPKNSEVYWIICPFLGCQSPFAPKSFAEDLMIGMRKMIMVWWCSDDDDDNDEGFTLLPAAAAVPLLCVHWNIHSSLIFLHHDGGHGGHGDHGDGDGDVDGDGLVVMMHHGDLSASSFNHQSRWWSTWWICWSADSTFILFPCLKRAIICAKLFWCQGGLLAPITNFFSAN